MPHLVVGNPERVVEEALVGGPEVVVRVDRTTRLDVPGQAPGLDRADALGARTVVFPVTGSAEDAALLLVHAREASLVVGVGTSVVLADFVDRSRADMAGTFLTRLTVGSRLVDPATVAQLHRRRGAHLAAVAAAARAGRWPGRRRGTRRRHDHRRRVARRPGEPSGRSATWWAARDRSPARRAVPGGRRRWRCCSGSPSAPAR